jgi:DNA-binding GntR family transcriptional regulator
LANRSMPIQSSSSNSGLAGWAYATMLERIVRGDYVIGQVISRRRIAADLGVSFLPASEAFLRLECEGCSRAGRAPAHESAFPTSRISRATLW